jgi:exoribonuclease R
MVQIEKCITNYIDNYDSINESTKLYSLYNNDILIKKIIGIVQLSSKNTKTLNRKYCCKLCQPILINLPKFFVKVNSRYNYTNDKYAIINIKLVNDKIEGTIDKYICEVGKDISMYSEYIEQISKINYYRKYDKFISDNISNINDDIIRNKYLDLGIYFDDKFDRTNLTNLETYSIDPKNSIDIDDAISFSSDINYDYIYIHIADPTSFIKENSFFDNELLNRTESIYLKSKTIDMIPFEFMKIISLLENKESRSITSKFTIKNNKIINFEIFRSKIIINKNYSYEEFDQKLKLTKFNKYTDIIQSISPISYDLFDSKKLIEIMAILTNHYVCKFLINNTKENILIRSQINNNKIDDNKINNDKIDEYFEYTEMLNKSKAQYKLYHKDFCYHDSLSLNEYTHFTSPMRRYSDMLVHRLISNIICNSDYDNDKINNKYIETLFKINHNKNYYQKIYYLENILTISNLINNNYDIDDRIFTFNAIVIQDNYILIDEKLNSDINIDVNIDKKIFDIIKNKIYFLQTLEDIKQYEKIKINISFLKKNFHKMKIYL